MATRIAIFFSNPVDTEHLQLDREHRAIDRIIERSGIGGDSFVRCHATSLDDLISVLSNESFDIIHFSGHGSSEGIVLATEAGNISELLSANKLRSVLQLARQEPKALLLLSCYSAHTLPSLITCAPFIVGVYGPADDNASIDFCSGFYGEYLRTYSIERAFGHAQNVVMAKGMEIAAVLSRRASHSAGGRSLFQVYPGGFDSLVVDITEAEADITRLEIAREQLLALLTRKLRVHKWLFAIPKENGLIQLGSYFGLFTWTNASDTVICHRILRVRKGIKQDLFNVWAALLVAYNDLFVDAYRHSQTSMEAVQRGVLKKATDAFHTVFKRFFLGEAPGNTLQTVSPDHFKLTYATVLANLEKADEKWVARDFAMVVLYLETSLTALHDFISHLSELITE